MLRWHLNWLILLQYDLVLVLIQLENLTLPIGSKPPPAKSAPRSNIRFPEASVSNASAPAPATSCAASFPSACNPLCPNLAKLPEPPTAIASNVVPAAYPATSPKLLKSGRFPVAASVIKLPPAAIPRPNAGLTTETAPPAAPVIP